MKTLLTRLDLMLRYPVLSMEHNTYLVSEMNDFLLFAIRIDMDDL